MESPSPNGHRAERECGCPPWATCVHWDGQIIWLADISLLPAEFLRGHTGRSRYAVVWGGKVQPCICGNSQHLIMDGARRIDYGYDLPAAEAEFRKREAALLEREPV